MEIVKTRTHKLTVSVIVTVLNEQENISDLLTSLTHQTQKPDELIIVDAGSTDTTPKTIKLFSQIRFFSHPGNRSTGRNFAIARAKGEIIAITDAGCIPDPSWLEELVKPFADKKIQVVSGYYRGLARSSFEKCLIPYVLVMPDMAGKSEFFPSTRSMAMRKSVWQNVAKFDERWWHNEDYVYAHTLKSAGISFRFTPKAVVSWLPRKNLKTAAWMFMRFAIGDTQAGIIRPQVKRLAVRYTVFAYLLFLNPWAILLAPPYLIWSIAKNFKYAKVWQARFWLPVLQITADISVLFGSIVGLLSRVYGV